MRLPWRSALSVIGTWILFVFAIIVFTSITAFMYGTTFWGVIRLFASGTAG